MTLLLTGIALACISTMVLIAVQNKNVLLSGAIMTLSVWLNLYAIIEVVGGQDKLLLAVGMGVGTSATVYWNKRDPLNK